MKNIEYGMGLSLAMIVMAMFANTVLAQPMVEKIGNGEMDWGSGEMSATGIGVPPPKYLKYKARARAMAVRAAKLDAMRNLLMTMKGVRLQSQTLVRDAAVESDLIRTTMEGVVRNASMVGPPHYMEDGSVEVEMAINYRQSVAKAIVHNYQASKRASITTPATPSVAAVTGLIIDARGKGLRTALAPRVLDEDGRVVYSGSMVTEEMQGSVVAYDNSVADASKLSRLGTNAMIIKALKVNDMTDVVISNADARTIGAAAGMQNTLRQAHVAFVL